MALGGDDFIHNNGSYTLIDGGKSNDFIFNSGSNVLFKYNAGDGYDTIVGFNETSTLQIGGSYSTTINGNDLIVSVGDGKITLVDAMNLSNINIAGNGQIATGTVVGPATLPTNNPLFITGTEGDDCLSNADDNATIRSYGGNDNISNSGSNVIIDAGAGHDYIDNSGDSVTIDGGDGSDTVDNVVGDNVTINGGADDDSIINYSSNVSINGGSRQRLCQQCGLKRFNQRRRGQRFNFQQRRLCHGRRGTRKRFNL